MADGKQLFQVTFTIFNQPYTEEFEGNSPAEAIGRCTDKLQHHVAAGRPVAVLKAVPSPTPRGH